jgi:hypothetical protein
MGLWGLIPCNVSKTQSAEGQRRILTIYNEQVNNPYVRLLSFLAPFLSGNQHPLVHYMVHNCALRSLQQEVVQILMR